MDALIGWRCRSSFGMRIEHGDAWAAVFMIGEMAACATAQAQRTNAAQTKEAKMNSNSIRSSVLVVVWVLDPEVGDALSSLNPRNTDVSTVIENAKGIEQPDDDTNHHHDVEDLFDLSVHRDVVVDQPEQHADDYQGDDERD
jgi:hypothetical protein